MDGVANSYRTNIVSNTHEIIRAAGSTDNATHQDYSRQILARATLLLRIATGVSAKLLSDAGFKSHG